jgi:hypothetical protein
MQSNQESFVKKIMFAALSAGSLMLFSTSAFADTVEVNGTSYTCTNHCTVTTGSNGNYSVSDCCGGRVSSQIQVQQ